MDSKHANITGGNVDYHSGPYNVTFPVGQIYFLLNVTIFNDSILETDETFMLTINSSSLPINVRPGDFVRAKVIIQDDDGKCIIQC